MPRVDPLAGYEPQSDESGALDRRTVSTSGANVSLLSRPAALGSNGWALPDLEVLDTCAIYEAEKWETFEMVEARYSFIEAQEDQGRRGLTLKPFRKIKLWHGGNYGTEDQAANAEFLTAIEKVARGAEIGWNGVKWVPSRASSP